MKTLPSIVIIISTFNFFANPLVGQITGPTLVDFGNTYQYSEPTTTGSPNDWTYYFTAKGGTVVPGQSQTQVFITWDKAANGTVEKWKSSTHEVLEILIQTLEVVVQDTPATEYVYDNAGNRIKRQVIILNVSTLKSGHNGAKDTSFESQIQDKETIEETLDGLDVKIYPNPTLGRIQVDLTGLDPTLPSSISIVSSNGAIIERFVPATEINEFDLSLEADGVYILTISVNNQSSQWKIIKQ